MLPWVKARLSLTTGSDNIDIGNGGVADEAGIIRIATDGKQTATYIAGIATSPLGAAGGSGRYSYWPAGRHSVIGHGFRSSLHAVAEVAGK